MGGPLRVLEDENLWVAEEVKRPKKSGNPQKCGRSNECGSPKSGDAEKVWEGEGD